ncbi:MAG: aminopeptidase P family protein [Elusimicrobia bacterium]|nr:aminopeptidase P family protein [Candidatus Liberimonas magnetica]
MIKRIENLIARTNGMPSLITRGPDLFYLTGINLDGYWLLLAKKEVFVLTSEMLAGQLKEALPDFSVIAGNNLFELLINLCKKNRSKKLGVSLNEISYALGKKLGKSIQLDDISGLLNDLRVIKDENEIKNIKISCRIAYLAAKYAQKFIKPGNTEIEIYYKIEEFFSKNHVKQSFPTIVASGPNSSLPHHITSYRKIRRNDVVLLDLGCIYKGYCSDLTRTFYLGKINKSQKDVYGLVKKAKDTALKSIKSGVESSKIDMAARNVIKHGGYGDNFIHSTGHGVGIEVHEPPRLSSKDKTVLKNGMVVTVEPGIYLKGEFGVRLEDTILVTRKGYKVLTD